MATLKITAMYARSGYSAYTGTGSTGYVAAGLFQSSVLPYSQFTNGKTYRVCMGFDFSALEGATITKIELFTQGSDNLGNGTSQWTMQLAGSNKWSHTTLASATASGVSGSNRWFSRTITNGTFFAQIAAMGGVGYIHVTQSATFKLWQGLTDSSGTWPYIIVTYTKADPVPEPPSVETITVSNFSVERCLYNEDTGSYEPSPSGTFARFSLTASLLTDGDYSDNALSTASPPVIIIRQAGSSSTSQVTGFWTSGTSCSIMNRLISGTFTPDTSWYFELSVSDAYQSVTVQEQIGSSHTILHVAGSRNGVAIGGYSGAGTNDARFECYYPAYFYGGIAAGLLSGKVDSTTVNSNSYKDVNVSFGKTLDHVPAVIISAETNSTGANIGSMLPVVLTNSVSTTGFVVRIYNTSTNNRGLAIRWLAM